METEESKPQVFVAEQQEEPTEKPLVENATPMTEDPTAMELEEEEEPAGVEQSEMDVDKPIEEEKHEEPANEEKDNEVMPEENHTENNVKEPEEPEIKKEIDDEPTMVAPPEGVSHIEMNNENIAEVKPLIQPKEEMENALSALASAAMDHMKEAEAPPEPPKDPKEIWHTVGFVKSTSFNVQNYFYIDESKLDFTDDKEPDISSFPKIPLEPGTAYKFRVAAVNSVGRSDWSDVSAFKTCVPGFPSAPSAIKIAKSADGAHISWEPPKGAITEYSVYLAVKNAKENLATASMAFVRVYAGPSNSCVVPHSSLATAHVDTTTKSAIIFRIAARNEKGYGPATQVRWLQESMNKPVKRTTDEAQAALKKPKTD